MIWIGLILSVMNICPASAQTITPSGQADKIELYFFYAEDCQPCQVILQGYLPSLKAMFPSLEIKTLDVGNPIHYEALSRLEKRLQRSGSELPIVLIGDQILSGEQEIMERLNPLLLEYQGKGSAPLPSIETPSLSKPSEKIFSVDISLEMLKINGEKNPDNRNVLLKAEAERLPFSDNYFDLAGISFGIRNFEKLESCVKEIHRVLKKGGILLVIEMFRPEKKNIVHGIFDFYFSKLVPRLGNKLSRSTYAYNYLFNSVNTFKSANEYCGILKEAGYEIDYKKNNFLGIVNTVLAQKI